jgi:tripartite ATP-independent transporter DctM subunit
MEWYLAGAAIVALLVFLIALGLPIPFALVASCLPFLWQIQTFESSVMTTEMMLWQAWDSYVLVSIPLFIFLGDLVAHSNIGSRLYDAIHRGVPIRGAAAHGSVGACAAFGAVCGSSMIGALTIGRVALPEMLRLGYSPRLSAGVLAAGGTLSVLIPPSLILLFYGIITNESIGRLFVAGVVPGILLTLLFSMIIALWTLARSADVPKRDVGGQWSLGAFFAGLVPPIIIGLIIFGSIYFGIATPTEAAAIAVAVTLVLAFAIGGLTIRGLGDSLWASIKTIGFLGILLSSALLFGFVLNYYRIPQELATLVRTAELSPYMILLLVIGFLLLIGMFLEPVAIIFICLPTLYPVVRAAGFDMVWFGVVFTITMEIAVLTPPVGLNLYVLQSMAPDRVSITDVIAGTAPFILAMVGLIVLLIVSPEIATYLVQGMRKG